MPQCWCQPGTQCVTMQTQAAVSSWIHIARKQAWVKVLGRSLVICSSCATLNNSRACMTMLRRSGDTSTAHVIRPAFANLGSKLQAARCNFQYT